MCNITEKYGGFYFVSVPKNIIPTTKTVGIISSLITGGVTVYYGNVAGGIITGIIGIMATLGLCILLEGFSTIIKLLRKTSETMTSQIHLLASLAEKAGVPIADINEVTKVYDIEFVE